MSTKLSTRIRQSVFESKGSRNSLALLAIVAVLAMAPIVMSVTLMRLFTQMLIFGLFAMGFDFLYGYNGVVSFGHAAFFGLGAYFFGVPLAQLGISSVWLLFGIALFAPTALGFLISLTLVRTQDTHFSILTLIWALVIVLVVENLKITGAHDGFIVAVPEFAVIPGVFSISLQQPQSIYYVSLISLILGFLLLRRLVNSPLGEVLKGGKANADRLNYIGYDERRFRIVSFTVSCGVAGLAGALQAVSTGYVSPSVMDFLLSGEVIIWTIVGGAGTLVGPVFGAAFVTYVENSLSQLIGWWQIPLSIMFIVVLIFMPEGIAGKFEDIRERYMDRRE